MLSMKEFFICWFGQDSQEPPPLFSVPLNKHTLKTRKLNDANLKQWDIIYE